MSAASSAFKVKLHALAASEGYALLEDFVRCGQTLLMRCPEGHEWPAWPSVFVNKGVRCRACAGQCPTHAGAMWRASAADRGWTIIGDYVKSRVPVEMRCPHGHSVSVAPNHFMNGRGPHCPRCSKKCPVAAREDFDAFMRTATYLQCTDYIDATTKIHVRCRQGHDLWLTPGQIRRNDHCNECLCRTPGSAGARFVAHAHERGYRVTGQYVNQTTRVAAVCPEGHRTTLRPYSFRQGHGCRACANQCPVAAWAKLRRIARRERYEVLSPPAGSEAKVDMRCPAGHLIRITSGSFRHGHRCGVCHPGGFDPEKPGYVYVLISSCGTHLKCGISNAPDKRIKSLRLTTPFEFTTIRTYRFALGATAYAVERRIHRRFARRRAFGAGTDERRFDGYSEWLRADKALRDALHAACVDAGATR